jgi:hypothetical protein
VADYYHVEACNPNFLTSFILVLLLVAVLSFTMALFVCPSIQEWGIVLVLAMSLLLIHVPLAVILIKIAWDTESSSHCFSWNVAVAIVSCIPWLWTCLIFTYWRWGLDRQQRENHSLVVFPEDPASVTVRS